MTISNVRTNSLKLLNYYLTFFCKAIIQSRMTMQVHDELVFDVYKPEVEQVKQIVGDLMRNALPLDVPVEVEMNTGDNWLAAH